MTLPPLLQEDQMLMLPAEFLVQLRAGGVKRITDIRSAYNPLHYFLLFPRGEQG